MDIIGHRKIYYAISGTMILVSLVSVALWRFRPGIDFAGGTLWEIGTKDSSGLAISDVTAFLNKHGIGDVNIQPSGPILVLRFKEIDEAAHQTLLRDAASVWPALEERRFETVGPTIGKTLRNKAIESVLGVLFVISIYIAFAFRRVSKPVASWKYGAVTVMTLFHDVIAPIGFFSILGRFKGVEIDTNFIVALLVVMGFSVHDTIVVFDRIRENLRKAARNDTFETVVNRSVRETFVRSVNTSLTVLLVLAALFVWGSATLKYFILALMIGIFVGTYSSIFIASPLLVDWGWRRSVSRT